MCTVLSKEPVAIRWLSGENASVTTPACFSLYRVISAPLRASQTETLEASVELIQLALAMYLPFADHATVVPPVGEFWRVNMSLPVAAFQTCNIPSLSPEATNLLSGDQATDMTPEVCPLYVTKVVPGGADEPTVGVGLGVGVAGVDVGVGVAGAGVGVGETSAPGAAVSHPTSTSPVALAILTRADRRDTLLIDRYEGIILRSISHIGLLSIKMAFLNDPWASRKFIFNMRKFVILIIIPKLGISNKVVSNLFLDREANY
jgi:hypothetical protein